MERFRTMRRTATSLLAALLFGLFACEPVLAAEGGFFTARRYLGLAFVGGSLVLVKQGFDFRSEADDLYDQYKRATNPQEADRLYRRTNNRDIKSQVSWALAAAFAVSGARLLVNGGSQEYARQASTLQREGLAVEPRVEGQRIGLHLSKRFF